MNKIWLFLVLISVLFALIGCSQNKDVAQEDKAPEDEEENINDDERNLDSDPDVFDAIDDAVENLK